MAFVARSHPCICHMREPGQGEAVMVLLVWKCLGEGATGASAGELREPSTSSPAHVCAEGNLSLAWLPIEVSMAKMFKCSTAS